MEILNMSSKENYQFLLDYFSNHTEKNLFFINDMIIDLQLSEPVLSQQLLCLTRKYSEIGTYNRNTGWFLRSEKYFPLLKKKKSKGLRREYILISLFLLSLLINWLILSLIITLFGLGLIMNKIFDDMSYLKDYKL